MKIVEVCNRIITYSFYILFFLVPLILTPFNYELFEYNKMMLTYALTTIIVGAWLIKMVVSRQFIFQRTPLDIPITIYFIIQLLSTIFSIDRHVSLFGYYSRFHGGLLSSLSYLLLYYALVANLDKEKVLKILKISLLAGLVVSIYGILEHFGIDKNLWVQDVQNRVFSTLGQPNWLAAYLVVLIPIALAFAINPKSETRNPKQISNLIYYLLPITYYLTLLYTKSRSGLLGFGVAYALFWLGVFWLNRPTIKAVLRPFLILTFSFLILNLIIGTPWTPSITNLKSQISNLKSKTEIAKPQNIAAPALETGGTESGSIRKIVWQGALNIARHYPLFGSGVETFAFSYYQFRLKEHNLTSEWDFLYNKAHNEYLNYAATTGFVGLGAYLLFILAFIIWFLKISNFQFLISNQIPNPKSQKNKQLDLDIEDSLGQLGIRSIRLIILSLFAGWLSILITNFFGFSVVPVALYFYLIPAVSFILISRCVQADPLPKWSRSDTLGNRQKITTIFVLLAIGYLLLAIARMWYADTRFNRAYQLAHAGYYRDAYQPFHQAINLNPQEPFYRDELSFTTAALAVAAWQQKEASLSSQLADEAIYQSRLALSISPHNVNFWKSRTKVFYALSSIDNKYDEEALNSLLMAQKLAPTDAKISYNLGLLYGQMGNNQMAIKILEETVDLKPDYKDARYALGLYYNETGQRQKAIDQLRYILEKISSDSSEVKDKLKEWQ